jgi:hypothetical protein
MTLDDDYCKMPHQPRMSSGVFLSVDADLRHISESEERVERLGNAQNKAMRRSRKSFRTSDASWPGSTMMMSAMELLRGQLELAALSLIRSVPVPTAGRWAKGRVRTRASAHGEQCRSHKALGYLCIFERRIVCLWL